MPYSNMPKSKWPKMESCVAKVKAQGNVENAYAVCYDSIMGDMKSKLAKRHAKKKKKK